MFLNSRIVCCAALSAVALGSSAPAFAFAVLSDCNQGAAVVDYERVEMGMRGDNHHAYQLVIRDQGVIDYLARQGVIAPRNLISGGHEALFSFHLDLWEPSVFSEGQVLATRTSGRGNEGYTYRMERAGEGVQFTARSPFGHEASWFFERCNWLRSER